ncbi:LysM peptidoglycan-binding domain-containing protein [Cellulomonas sp. NS3]|uniref:LysM peptidoglycan-binding domain-containing protein n=1 Tax=Cellulomonas sp. NS3 TaxID=2973977 RepID=UPI0021639F3D|nr:hypothetical protein [Cellulomonas sp. NS3]
MRGQRTTTTRPGVRLLAAAALPLGLAASAALAWALAVRLRALLPMDLATASVDRVVELGVVGLGLALVVWLTWGLALATSCAAARTVGLTWRAGERAVARHAPSVVRRALVVALGAGLGVSGAVGAHATTPGDGLDVGWSATTASSPAPVPTPAASTSPGPPGAGPVTPPPSAAHRGVHAPDALDPAPTRGSVPATPSDALPGSDATQAEGTGHRSGTATTSPAGGTAPGAGADAVAARPGTPAPAPAGVATWNASSPATPASESATAARSAGTDAGPATGVVPAPDAGAGAGAGAGDTVVVAAGDSLWRIAQRALGPDATHQEVAAEWPRWYAANADVLGADPDLVLPGQVLRAPSTGPTPGGTP